jgi:rhodanese-related sulfurtransferase
MKKIAGLLFGFLSLIASAEGEATKSVFISPNVVAVEVLHDGELIKLQRNQNKNHKISSFYLKTARGKIQPMFPFAPHAVETIAELDVIDYLRQKTAGDDTIFIIDTRTPNWLAITGSIPSAVNIPYTKFNNKESALDIMEDQLDVQTGEIYDFSYAKTLIMYCNGIWCGQTPAAIKALLKYGYPATKIKYYRGGMNAWKSLGLTTVN